MNRERHGECARGKVGYLYADTFKNGFTLENIYTM